MGNDPAFLFYPGDYLRDTQCMTEQQQVAYDRMMCEHMRNICISKTKLNFFTKKLPKEEKDYLVELLVPVSGGYQIQWVAESIEKRRAYSESRRKNRNKVKKNISKTYDSHMEIEDVIEIEKVNKSKDIKEDVVFPENSKESKELTQLAIDCINKYYSSVTFGPAKYNDFQIMFDKLLRQYSFDQIKSLFNWLQGNKFWHKHFRSPEVLVSEDKNDIKYIDIYLSEMENESIEESKTNKCGGCGSYKTQLMEKNNKIYECKDCGVRRAVGN